MKAPFLLIVIFVLSHFCGFSQDRYSKLAFIQTRNQNTTMFVQNGFQVKHTSLKNNGVEDYFKQVGEENEYALVYNSLGNLETLSIYTTEEDFNSFMASCRKTCDSETAVGEGVIAIYSNGIYRYVFETYIGWVEMGYKVEIQKIE